MSSNGVKPFENNWAYLKTELRWLDRVLMMAVARKRQDDKTLQRVAKTHADEVTSHWWKGIIAVNRGIDDREGPPPTQSKPTSTTTVSYAQQLQARIQACRQAGIVLALPLLRDRLKLTQVEKNILLMAIAPEINRRYGRLYDFLQDEEGALADLPTVDLCLRLLCRNDDDWQQARARLTGQQSLASRGLVEWIGDEEGTLLSQQVRVSDELANFLLSGNPSVASLEALLSESLAETTADIVPSQEPPSLPEKVTPRPPLTSESQATADTSDATAVIVPSWDTLVVPKKLRQQLQYLGRQAQSRQQQSETLGLMVLLVGAAGTGKTTAAAKIAAQMQVSLNCVDLQTLTPEQYPDSLTAAPSENASLLMVKHGEQWFGRKSQVEQSWLHQWWQWRQQFGITFVCVDHEAQLRPHWRQQFDCILAFPHPSVAARQQLWQQAFAADMNTDKLDWRAIAQQLPLTGGEIHAIAQAVQIDLRAKGRSTVTLTALRGALQLLHPDLTLKTATKR